MPNSSRSWASFYATSSQSPSIWPENFVVRVFRSKAPVAFLREYAFDDRSALDLGCGQGRHILFLQSLGLSVTGLEVSQDLVSDLERDHPNASFVKGSNIDIPLEDASVDFILAANSIYYLDSAAASFETVMTEVHRVMKPGGALVCSFVGHQHAILQAAERKGDIAIAGSDHRTFENGIVLRPLWDGEQLADVLSPLSVHASGEILETAEDNVRHLHYAVAYKDA